MYAITLAGFSDGALDSQEVFRFVLDAMARPGTIHRLRPGLLENPSGIAYAAVAVCLALIDADTPLWLDARTNTKENRDYLRFHCGVSFTESLDDACFALLGQLDPPPPLSAFPQGTPTYPDRSCTLIIQVSSLDNGPLFSLRGPGIPSRKGWEKTVSVTGLVPDFLSGWAMNNDSFPLGVDLVLCAGSSLMCLPRTTRITPKEQPCT